MYDQRPSLPPHRLPMNNATTNSKSRLNPPPPSILKRQPSGHIPSLNVKYRPLANSTNLPPRSILKSENKRKLSELEDDAFEYDALPSNYASVQKQQQLTSSSSSNTQIPVKRTKSEQSVTTKRKLSIEDDSLRIVTSTIQGMKHWTNKYLPYPILFEVFGKLDSQVSYLPSLNSRQFSLIDERDRIECIFAEIDQTFSQIDRDVQLRVICRLEPGSNIARCMAIRVAREEEWRERKDVIKHCDIQLNDDDVQMKKQKKNSTNQKK